VDLHAAVAVSEGAAAEVPFPEPVVVPRWKWRVYLHPASWAVALGMIAVILVSVAVHAIAGAVAFGLFGRWFGDAALPPTGTFGTWTSTTWVLAGLAVAALAVSTIASCMWCIRRLQPVYMRALMATVRDDDPARSLKRAELAESGPLDSWTKAQAARWLSAVRAGSDARMFVSVPIAEGAEQYDRTDRPVEPERVGGIAGSRDAGALLGCAAMAAVGFWRFGAATPLFWGFGVAFVAILVRMVRRRTLFSPVVAGQGWIQHGAARWTVEDSVVVVTGRPGRHPVLGTGALVCVVGPPGVMTMRLDARPGKDLEVLWMRWMHPHPNLSQQAFDA
jgi:hypothetical protein